MSLRSRFSRDWWVERGPIVVVAVATVALLILAIHDIGRRSVSFDEAVTYYVSSVRWRRLLEIFQGADPGWHPPTYFVAVKIWRSVVGSDEVALRALSTVFAVGSVPLMYLLGARMAGRWTGAIAAVVLAGNSFVVQYAHTARTYTLTMLLAIASWWLLLKAIERPALRWWIAYAAVALLGLYSHLFFGLVLLAQYLSMLVPALRPPSLRGPALAAGVIGVLGAPLVLGSLSESEGILEWVDPISADRILASVRNLTGGTDLTLLAYAAAIAVAVSWAVRGRTREAVVPALLWLVVPLVAIAAVSVVRPVWVTRYLILVVPALALLVAIGITRIRIPAVVAVLTALVLAVSVTGFVRWYEAAYPDWRGAAAILDEQGSPDDGLFLAQRGIMRRLGFHIEHLEVAESTPRLIDPPRPWGFNTYAKDQRRNGARRDFRQCAFDRVWLVASNERQAANAYEDRDRFRTAYDLERTIPLERAVLQLYTRNDTPCPP